jgi:2-polyprenyl-3-methyl-5-hydroxy-6-metoxy-1,4-benzoquinol methylase
MNAEHEFISSPTTVSEHYNAEYFQFQAPIGEFGAWANIRHFSGYVKPDMKVLDFGCGGGYLLEKLICRQKRGVEVNSSARGAAMLRQIDVVASVDEIDEGWADLIISNSVLEHCLHPLQELKLL